MVPAERPLGRGMNNVYQNRKILIKTSDESHIFLEGCQPQKEEVPTYYSARCFLKVHENAEN